MATRLRLSGSILIVLGCNQRDINFGQGAQGAATFARIHREKIAKIPHVL